MHDRDGKLRRRGALSLQLQECLARESAGNERDDAGFDRNHLLDLLRRTGFVDPAIATACEVTKESRRYPIFLVTATRTT